MTRLGKTRKNLLYLLLFLLSTYLLLTYFHLSLV